MTKYRIIIPGMADQPHKTHLVGRYEFSVFGALQDLHCATTGSGDPDLPTQMMGAQFLRARLDDWTPHSTRVAAQEKLIKALAQEVLQNWIRHTKIHNLPRPERQE